MAGRPHGWAVDPDRIRPLPDVIKGLEAAIALFSRPGSPVILPTPAYMPFLSVPPLLGREIIQVPMGTAGGRAVLDLDGIDAAFRAGGHLLILCNPCNPVGRVYTQAELSGVSEVVERHGGRCSPTRSTHRSPTRATSTCRMPPRRGHGRAHPHRDLGVQGLEPARPQVRPADPQQRRGPALWAEAGRLMEHGASTPGCTPTSRRSPRRRTGSPGC